MRDAIGWLELSQCSLIESMLSFSSQLTRTGCASVHQLTLVGVENPT